MTVSYDAPHKARPLLANLATGLFVYFVVILIVLHGLRPDYTPIDHMISDYAVGRFGGLMTSAFMAMSLGCLCLSLGLWRDGPRTAASLIGRIFLLVVFAGLLVTAAFATDLEGALETQHGNIHTISFLVNVVGILLAALTLSFSFGADARWKSFRPAALIVAFLLIIAFVGQFLTLHRGMPYGITNRIFVTVMMVWLIAVAWRLRTVSKAGTV